MARATRAEQTLATRRRMVAAGYRLFCSNGYLGTTMTAVATEAGVAVQTLYYTFHTKAELLGEALGAAVIGFDDWLKPPREPAAIDDLSRLLPWWAEFESTPDAATALRVFVRRGVEVLERAGPLVTALHGSTGDPDAAAVVALGEQRRVDTYRAAVETIGRKDGGLRRSVKVSDATDIVVALFSADVYHSLTSGRGWSRSRCERFFLEVLTSQLL